MSIKKIILASTVLFSTIAFTNHMAFAQTVVDYSYDEGVDVDVELQLLLDTSGSISNQEYSLQMDGYSYAFNDQSIRDLILDTSNGDYGSIAVQTVMWSSGSRQQVMSDWTLLDSNDSIDSFVSELSSMTRPFSGGTYTAEALDYGASQFASNGYNGTRTVIDISGDGYGIDYLYDYYYGEGTADQYGIASTSEARDNVLASGLVDTINGVSITYDYSVADVDLTTWYSQNIIGGEDAFVIQAGDFTDFRAALTKKLAAEIEGGYIPEGAIAPGEVYSAPAPILGQGMAGIIFALFYFLRRRVQSF